MEVIDIARLGSVVIWSVFAVTFVLGAIMQKTGFCSMGAIADIFIISSWNRLRQWFLAIGTAIIGFTLLAHLGWIDSLKSFYTGNKFLWLSTIIGSVLFGFGMVLASGCGSKTLIRIGGGNLKSVVVFLVLGLTAYMTMRGFLAVIRTNTVDLVSITFATPQDLPSLLAGPLGVSRVNLHLVLGLIFGSAFIAFALFDVAFHLTRIERW